jgi:hypothetical protein
VRESSRTASKGTFRIANRRKNTGFRDDHESRDFGERQPGPSPDNIGRAAAFPLCSAHRRVKRHPLRLIVSASLSSLGKEYQAKTAAIAHWSNPVHASAVPRQSTALNSDESIAHKNGYPQNGWRARYEPHPHQRLMKFDDKRLWFGSLWTINGDALVSRLFHYGG